MGDETPTLAEAFRTRASKALALTPHLRFEWSADFSELRFPRIADDGFDILVKANLAEITVSASGAHEHLPLKPHPPSDVVDRALGLVRDLLSPDMRVRELISSGAAYRWFLETLRDGSWVTESEGGLLLFNYFGRRDQRIYQNRQLPGRIRGS